MLARCVMVVDRFPSSSADDEGKSLCCIPLWCCIPLSLAGAHCISIVVEWINTGVLVSLFFILHVIDQISYQAIVTDAVLYALHKISLLARI